MDKHSPLPWKLANPLRVDNNDRPIARTLYYRGSEDAGIPEANAAYIVKACNLYPRLVEALRAVLEMHSVDRGDPWRVYCQCTNCKNARAILAEAEAE